MLVCPKLFTTKAQKFRYETAESLAAVDQADPHLQCRGIWTMDRGCDRKRLLDPLLDKHLRFVIFSTSERMVRERRGRLRSAAEAAQTVGYAIRRAWSGSTRVRRIPIICITVPSSSISAIAQSNSG